MIEKLIEYFKKIFKRKETIQMLEAPIKNNHEEKRNNFKESLKVNGLKNKKNEVETLICYGDGLGIQTKISY